MSYICLLIAPIVFVLTLESSFGQSIAESADEQAVTLIAQETEGGSETVPQAEGEEEASEDPGISFSLWAAIAAVLGFGFGGLLAMRARAKAKAEKLNNQN